ncbi:hypothetical protein SLA2020_111240 [Shorea laevis]
MGEEESVDVVADSFEMDMEEDDAGERDGIGMCESRLKLKTFSNSDPIASSGSYGLDIQPSSDPLDGYVAKGKWAGEGLSKENWASERLYDSSQTGIEMRPEKEVKKKDSRENAENKGTNILENCSSCCDEMGSIEGSREKETGTAQEKDKKKRKKRNKSFTSVYQKSILLGLMKQKKKSRGRSSARQAEEEAVPVFLPSTSNSIASGSVEDSGI